ncbi:heat shock protein Hsp70 family protein [Solidesulfovibrio magneticus RS-1]|uniref:Heat shock protein Hsp70 family protein n=2 Tax=Solidesulfovibrio TaxID=2910984 RepID=C4XHU6_SOLM1|nr:heat shock protein Hsp70 family protein [Solidesulfovibrio magneticus RS-1]
MTSSHKAIPRNIIKNDPFGERPTGSCFVVGLTGMGRGCLGQLSARNVYGEGESVALGIDFGTSNSAVGLLKDGLPCLVALEDGKQTIPSAIFYDTEEDAVLFGNAAIAFYMDGCEGRLLRSLKSILGSSLVNESTEVGYKNIAFKDIIVTFVRHLKIGAETAVGHAVDSVVMGRPVRFVDADEQADALAQAHLEEIARKAGFREVLFQYEPIAAALDYEQSVQQEELALIVDIGGGTSDFSIVRVSPDRRGKADRKQDILANTGVHVGGTDLDLKLSLEQVMPLFGYRTRTRSLFPGDPILDLPPTYYRELATWHKIVFLYNNRALQGVKNIKYHAQRQDLVDRLVRIIERQEGHRLAGDVEAAKIALSQQDAASIALSYVEKGLEASLRRQEFESDIAPETASIVSKIDECLSLAGVPASAIQTLFMTGGSTAIPRIAQACRQAVPAARLVEGSRFGSVGIGLALDAGMKFGA